MVASNLFIRQTVFFYIFQFYYLQSFQSNKVGRLCTVVMGMDSKYLSFLLLFIMVVSISLSLSSSITRTHPNVMHHPTTDKIAHDLNPRLASILSFQQHVPIKAPALPQAAHTPFNVDRQGGWNVILGNKKVVTFGP